MLSLRLKGIYEDLSNNYEKAIEYYLQSLEAARLHTCAGIWDGCFKRFGSLPISAIRETEKAKEFYL